MRKLIKSVFVLLLFFAFSKTEGQICKADVELDIRIQREKARFKRTATDSLMDVLAIKPGMTILDIGTGTGQFAYEFAQRTKGDGKVFATDVDADCINYVKKEADRKGLPNLYPVLVQKQGLDEFYGKYRYDLITIFHTDLFNQDYLEKLRYFLAEGGRLVIIFNENTIPFSPGDFRDFKGLVKEISREPPDSPFYKSLRQSTRELVRQASETEPDGVLKNAIVEDLNSMLADIHFGGNFVDVSGLRKDLAFSPEERDYAYELLVLVREATVFDTEKGTLSSREISFAKRFNKLLIFQKFRSFLFKDKIFKSALSRKIKDCLERAGYKLEKEIDNLVVPFQDVLVFIADKEAEGK